MAWEFDFEFRFVRIVPFALLLEENVAGRTPGIRPFVILIRVSRKPYLGGIIDQMLANISHEAATVFGALDRIRVIALNCLLRGKL